MYKLIITPHFKRDFKKMASALQEKAVIFLKKLQKNPLKFSEKLKGVKRGIHRIRIGNYRIRFDIVKKDIVLHSFKHRKDIYKQ